MKITSKQLIEIFKIDPRLRDFYHSDFSFKHFCNLAMDGKGNPDINVLTLLYDLLRCIEKLQAEIEDLNDLLRRIEKLQAEIEDLKQDKPLQYVFNAPDKESMDKLIEIFEEGQKEEEIFLTQRMSVDEIKELYGDYLSKEGESHD